MENLEKLIYDLYKKNARQCTNEEIYNALLIYTKNQLFENRLQKETPNPWIEEHSWLTPAGVSYTVPFRGFSLKSSLYDIDVAGYNNKSIHLHLFDIDLADESMVHDGISFNKKDILHNLTLFLYPDDSDDDGRKLRIFQQYFMVSNAAQFILDEATKKG